MSPIHELPSAGMIPVVLAAAESGILADLQAGLQLNEITRKRGLDLRASQLVVDALCALGLCTRRGDQVEWPARLDDGYPWTELSQFLRTGDIGSLVDRSHQRGALYAQVVEELSNRVEPFAREAAQLLCERQHIVDVGAGSGAWSLAMATRYERARVTAIDLPEVLPAFAKRAQRHGVFDRVSCVEGSYFEVPPPTPYDRVVFANVLHLESDGDVARLIGRFADSLNPGGDVVIFDCLGDERAESYVRFRAFYALHLGMRTRRGGVHSEANLRRWCEEAGLQRVRRVDLPSGSGLGFLVGEK